MDLAVSLENVSFAYDGEDVLQQVSLKLKTGSFLAVIGPNGGGKTTLIKLLLGMLRPRRGTVTVLGQDPALETPNVGYVPQHAAFAPRFPITVQEVVLLGVPGPRQFRLRPPAAVLDRAMTALSQVDMDGYAQRRFDTLSGGQRQRVLVARAMASSPALLLFDEPTSNIDPQGRVCLFDILSKLSSTITIVLVSHDIISASAGLTDVAVINRQLIQGREITPEMLELIYGVHDTSCPLDGYLKNLTSVFEQVERPGA